MSARSPMAGPPLPRFSVPTTPVLARPWCTSMPQPRSRSATRAAVRRSSNAVSGCAWRSRRHAVISSWKDAIRLMICMGVDIAWRVHERQGPAVHAEDKPLFKLFHLDECPTNAMEPGRGEQIKLINPSLGTEKGDVHLNRLVPGRPRGKHHPHHNTDNVYIVKRGEGRLTIEDKTYTVRENDVIYIPAGLTHSLSNLSNDVFEIFEIYAPSGKHMDFVLDE